MLRLQRYRPENYEGLKVAFSELFDDSEQVYFDELNINGPSYIGLNRAGEIQAFILSSHTPDKIASYEISYLGVLPRYRRKGYGARLIELVRDAVGPGGVWLNVLDSNTNGCALYVKSGFDQVSVFSTETQENGIVYVCGVRCHHCLKPISGKNIRLEKAVARTEIKHGFMDSVCETIRVCWHCRTISGH